MTPADLALALPKPLESVYAALNLSHTAVLPNGHIDFPAYDTAQYRLFIACMAKQPNEAQRLLRDIRNMGSR